MLGLVNDLLSIVANYTTFRVTVDLISFHPGLGYSTETWWRKSLYETRGLVIDRGLVTNYPKYYLTVNRTHCGQIKGAGIELSDPLNNQPWRIRKLFRPPRRTYTGVIFVLTDQLVVNAVNQISNLTLPLMEGIVDIVYSPGPVAHVVCLERSGRVRRLTLGPSDVEEVRSGIDRVISIGSRSGRLIMLGPNGKLVTGCEATDECGVMNLDQDGRPLYLADDIVARCGRHQIDGSRRCGTLHGVQCIYPVYYGASGVIIIVD